MTTFQILIVVFAFVVFACLVAIIVILETKTTKCQVEPTTQLAGIKDTIENEIIKNKFFFDEINNNPLNHLEETMTAIAERVHTDKVTHGFTEFYPRHMYKLRHRPVKLLEVGLLHGSSLDLWDNYFDSADIHILEFNQEYIDIQKEKSPHVNFTNLNMDDKKAIKKYVETQELGTFDIVIDDGGHTMLQQMNALVYLLPLLKPGGIFVMEDVHTSFQELGKEFGVLDIIAYTDSVLHVIQNIIGRRPNAGVNFRYITDAQLTEIKSKIRGGESFLYKDHGTVVIYVND